MASLLTGFLLFSSNAMAQRPVIVFIHGRNQAFNVTEQLRLNWYGAFRDGIEKLGRGPFVGDTSELRFISYEGLYEPGYKRQPCGPFISSVSATRGVIDGALQWLSHAIARTVGLATVSHFLEDINAYLTAPEMRCATDRRLTIVLDSMEQQHRPVVLVGHSMGTLIIYHVLDPTHPARYHIQRFVSLGSQLGSTSMVQSLIGNFSPPFLAPVGVHDWVNIRGYDDFVAPELVRNQFKFTAGYFKELEIETKSGDPHSIVAYLKHPQTALAIAKGWCDAFGSSPSMPAQCVGLPDVQDKYSDPVPD